MSATRGGLTAGSLHCHPGDDRIVTEDDPQGGGGSHTPQAQRNGKERCSKKVHVAFLPERYEPLIEEDEIKAVTKQDRKLKKKEKYKRYRKNVRKALRFSWKCLVVGLQSFAASYSTPVSAATVLMTNPNRTRT
ncbi:required for drug-induced death protein 1 [Conger conger]|uniref:required for drug-induced death protein 1 n=1 Tax=Conger conger TaxID=82655 RepID=UPI002A59AC8F|nr:required for drug-induced death protein 1 [Conger conger]